MPDWLLYLLIAIVAVWFIADGIRDMWACVGVDEWDDDGTKP